MQPFLTFIPLSCFLRREHGMQTIRLACLNSWIECASFVYELHCANSEEQFVKAKETWKVSHARASAYCLGRRAHKGEDESALGWPEPSRLTA